ncbi:hypothetical protein D3C76_1305090 [compost metagenome]
MGFACPGLAQQHQAAPGALDVSEGRDVALAIRQGLALAFVANLVAVQSAVSEPLRNQ